jgi:ankyrin repeat protein
MSKKNEIQRHLEEYEDDHLDLVEPNESDSVKADSETFREKASYSVILGRGLVTKTLISAKNPMSKEKGSGRPKGDSLEKAMFKRNFARIQRIVRAGANLDEPGSNGITPLMMAVDNGDVELARYLVKSGANVNAMGADGTTALALVIGKGDVDLMIEVISLGADVNWINAADETPLMEALYSGAAPESIFRMADILLKCGANPDHMSEETDETPRNIALKSKRPELIWLFQKGAVERPVSKKAHGAKVLKLWAGNDGKKLDN